MSITLILLLIATGALILPNIGGGDDDDGDDRNEILGGPEDDVVNGTEENDLIRTFLGNDTIYGNGGNDEIRAGDGDDYIEGGEGLDFIRGGAGDDEIYGNAGDDRIIADRGDDYVDAGLGSDVVRGGQGNDTILGGINSEIVDGKPTGNFGATDQLSGEGGDDRLYVWGGNSTAVGGGVVPNDQSDDDALIAVTGKNFLTNGPGENIDIVLANASDDQITFATVTDFNTGDDTLVMTVDYDSTVTSAADLADYDIEATYRDSADDDPRGNGVYVDLRLNYVGADPEGAAPVVEASRVFLEGLTAASVQSSLNIELHFTEDASYVDPDSTTFDDGDTVLERIESFYAPTPV